MPLIQRCGLKDLQTLHINHIGQRLYHAATGNSKQAVQPISHSKDRALTYRKMTELPMLTLLKTPTNPPFRSTFGLAEDLQ
ncbi:hypothetical protein KJ807_05685 [Patescibacteria group bacterium]|nr:hypothetical protein [Patescibacteria group bacterium]